MREHFHYYNGDSLELLENVEVFFSYQCENTTEFKGKINMDSFKRFVLD